MGGALIFAGFLDNFEPCWRLGSHGITIRDTRGFVRAIVSVLEDPDTPGISENVSIVSISLGFLCVCSIYVCIREERLLDQRGALIHIHIYTSFVKTAVCVCEETIFKKEFLYSVSSY